MVGSEQPGRRLRNIRVQSKYRKVRLAAASRHVAGREGGAKGDVDRCVNQNKARRAPQTGWGGGSGSENQTRADSSRLAPGSIAQCPRAEGGQRGKSHVLFWAWDLKRTAPGRCPGLWVGPRAGTCTVPSPLRRRAQHGFLLGCRGRRPG